MKKLVKTCVVFLALSLPFTGYSVCTWHSIWCDQQAGTYKSFCITGEGNTGVTCGCSSSGYEHCADHDGDGPQE